MVSLTQTPSRKARLSRTARMELSDTRAEDRELARETRSPRPGSILREEVTGDGNKEVLDVILQCKAILTVFLQNPPWSPELKAGGRREAPSHGSVSCLVM